jgi:hypothetical protein
MWEVYIKHIYSFTLIGLRYNYFVTLRERETEKNIPAKGISVLLFLA